jgi:hypothetical protein
VIFRYEETGYFGAGVEFSEAAECQQGIGNTKEG